MSKNHEHYENKLREKSNRRNHDMRNTHTHKNKYGGGTYRNTNYQEANKYDISNEEGDQSYSQVRPPPKNPADCIGTKTVQFIFRILLVICAGIALAAASLAPGLLPNDHIG